MVLPLYVPPVTNTSVNPLTLTLALSFLVNVKVWLLLLNVPPVTYMSVNPVKNPVTLNVQPVFFVKVAVPVEELYVPPVIVTSDDNIDKLTDKSGNPSFRLIVKS